MHSPGAGRERAWRGAADAAGRACLRMHCGLDRGALMDAAAAPDLTPWEQRERGGVFRGFVETLKGAAFSPGTFLDRLHPDTRWTEAFWYGWLVQVVFGTLGALLAVVPMLALHGGALPTPLQL